MECTYYHYFCGDPILCIKLLIIILAVLGVPLLPVLSLINVCNYKDRFMTDVICYLTGFVNIIIGWVVIYMTVAMCRVLHEHIMEHKFKYESPELIDNA
jgi:hypothetical protein